MKIEFKTRTGSTYVIDKTAMTWERKAVSAKSGQIRTQGGPLTEWPIVTIGEGVEMFGPPLDETKDFRLIYTGDVLSWKEVA